MPKKSKPGSSFGRKSPGAKAMAKQREDIDYAAEERGRQQQLMALRRQDSEVREKERLAKQELRKNKKFRAQEREKKTLVRRESRDSWLARKEAEGEYQAARVNEILAKLYYIEQEVDRRRMLLSVLVSHGFDKTCNEDDYQANWFDELRKVDSIEWYRATCELLWGYRCRRRCSSKADSCPGCEQRQFFFEVALYFRARFLSLPRKWGNEVQDIIEEGPRCFLCLTVAVPHGDRNPHAPPCQRCEIGREARAKLIDFWNHLDERHGVTTKFLNHSHSKCVCEIEAVLSTPPESSEESSEEYSDVESEDDEGEEDEEEDEMDPRDLE